MSYISGASPMNKSELPQLKWMELDLTMKFRYRLGISGNIQMNELTKYQIDQIEQIISQDHVLHWQLKRGERADIERFISISRYRGIRHQPLRGQRMNTNARAFR